MALSVLEECPLPVCDLRLDRAQEWISSQPFVTISFYQLPGGRKCFPRSTTFLFMPWIWLGILFLWTTGHMSIPERIAVKEYLSFPRAASHEWLLKQLLLELPRLLTNRKIRMFSFGRRRDRLWEADYICQPHFLMIKSGEADVEWAAIIVNSQL